MSKEEFSVRVKEDAQIAKYRAGIVKCQAKMEQIKVHYKKRAHDDIMKQVARIHEYQAKIGTRKRRIRARKRIEVMQKVSAEFNKRFRQENGMNV